MTYFIVRRDSTTLTRSCVKFGFVLWRKMRNSSACIYDLIHLVSRVTTHESSSKYHECGTKLRFSSLWLWTALDQFSSASTQTCPHEGLSGQGAISTSHTQAQSHYTEVCRLPCLHWKVWKKKRNEYINRFNVFKLWMQVFLFDPFQMVYYQWPICTEWPVSLLRQVLPDAALWCSRQQAGRFPGLPLCGPGCI